MRTNFFCTNFLNTPKGPGHPGKISGTSQIPLFETQGRQTFEGGHELFGHRPFAWKTPTPPGGLRTQKVNLCVLFPCLMINGQIFSKTPTGPPDPLSPKTPQQQKKKVQKTRKPRLSPKVNARSPKSKRSFLKVNARTPNRKAKNDPK